MIEQLTQAERETLNAAMSILQSKVVRGASLDLYVASYRFQDEGCAPIFGVTYFDSLEGALRTQHSGLPGDTFADKVDAAIAAENAVHVDPDKVRADKVAELRAQLAQLEGLAA